MQITKSMTCTSPASLPYDFMIVCRERVSSLESEQVDTLLESRMMNYSHFNSKLRLFIGNFKLRRVISLDNYYGTSSLPLSLNNIFDWSAQWRSRISGSKVTFLSVNDSNLASIRNIASPNLKFDCIWTRCIGLKIGGLVPSSRSDDELIAWFQS